MQTKSTTPMSEVVPRPMMLDVDPFLTVAHLAELTHTSKATVYDWNLKGTSPIATKVGRSVLYRQSDVEAWLSSHRMVVR